MSVGQIWTLNPVVKNFVPSWRRK